MDVNLILSPCFVPGGTDRLGGETLLGFSLPDPPQAQCNKSCSTSFPCRLGVNLYAAGRLFGKYKMMQKPIKMAETLANGYSSESTQLGLSNGYQHDRLQIIFKKFCVLVLWMKVASALEGLTLNLIITNFVLKCQRKEFNVVRSCKLGLFVRVSRWPWNEMHWLWKTRSFLYPFLSKVPLEKMGSGVTILMKIT